MKSFKNMFSRKKTLPASDISGSISSCEFDKLFTSGSGVWKTCIPFPVHILEKICLSLDYETFKNCLRVNKAWRGVLTRKVFHLKVKSAFREEITDEENSLVTMSKEGDTDGVRRVLSSGLVNVDCDDGRFRPWGPKTPLIYASSEGHSDIVRLLINAGADVNQEGPANFDEWQESPLMVAANYDYFDVVKLLIEAGAEADKVDQFGKTPLLRAAWNSSSFGENSPVPVLKLLLDNGANVNRADQSGTTPLIAAAVMGDYDVAKLLIDRGADLEKANKNWRAPLMTAVDNNCKKVVQLLIDSGADVIHGDGLTAPMGLAVEKGRSHEEVLRMLFNGTRFSSKMTLEEFLNYNSD